MQPPKLPQISNNLILAVGIILVGLVAVADMILLLGIQASTQQAVTALYNYISQFKNSTFELETNGHLAYMQNEIYSLSQQANTTSQDSLRRINNLTKEDENLTNRLDALNSIISSINFTDSPAQVCTNTTTTVYVNQTTPASATDDRTCRAKLLDKYQLGDYFDLVYCCESRAYGFADECCACYK